VINFTVDLSKQMLRGRETIRLLLATKRDFLVVHAAANVRIKRAFLATLPLLTPRPLAPHELEKRAFEVGEIFLAQRIDYNAQYEHYVLQWRELSQFEGQDVLLGLDFETKLLGSMRGAYLSSYLDAQGASHSLVATQFEATDARAAFPCFDEPRFKVQSLLCLRCRV
jgi:aminopeptidase N